MSDVGNLIENFKKQINKWSEENQDIKFVFNNDLDFFKDNYKDIKYILIGDNPGNIETEKKRYFVGPSGISARVFFENFLVNDFKKEVLVLNKTPIHTSQTHFLKLKNNKIINDTQKYMANLSFKLYKNLLNSTVIITGFMGACSNKKWISQSNKNNLGYCFFKQIKENFKEIENKLHIIKHFSFLSIYKDLTIENFEKLSKYEKEYIFKLIDKGYSNTLFKSDKY